MDGLPKLIMQTWKNEDIPEKWRSSQDKIVELHSPKIIKRNKVRIHKGNKNKWKYVLMTDEDNRAFVARYFPQYLEMYDGFDHPIQRADVIRYMWLYINGGVYMDLDYEPMRNIEPLFNSGAEVYLIKSPNMAKYLTNSFMASKPRCSFWLEVLEEVKARTKLREWWAHGKHLKVMMTTGPGVVSKAVENTRVPYTILPQNLVNNISVQDFKKMPNRDEIDTFLYPLEGCSWGGMDTKLANWAYQNPLLSIFFAGIIILVIIFFIVDINKKKKSKKFKKRCDLIATRLGFSLQDPLLLEIKAKADPFVK